MQFGTQNLMLISQKRGAHSGKHSKADQYSRASQPNPTPSHRFFSLITGNTSRNVEIQQQNQRSRPEPVIKITTMVDHSHSSELEIKPYSMHGNELNP